jgi:uncharacterized protein YigA (DUF484 family)
MQPVHEAESAAKQNAHVTIQTNLNLYKRQRDNSNTITMTKALLTQTSWRNTNDTVLRMRRNRNLHQVRLCVGCGAYQYAALRQLAGPRNQQAMSHYEFNAKRLGRFNKHSVMHYEPTQQV